MILQLQCLAGRLLVRHTRVLLESRTMVQRCSGRTAAEFSFDSLGDYEHDARELEDQSLPLYSKQSDLPKLPVPSIAHSLKLFLQSSIPFVSSSEEEESLMRAVATFPSQADVLQRRLQERAHRHSSWLQQLWNEQGYLQPRCSNVINVSYFFRYILPPRSNNPIVSRVTLEERGAAILHAAAVYAETIRGGTKPVDELPLRRKGKSKGTSAFLCSSQYKYLFGACRVPGAKQDSYRLYYCNKQNQKEQAAQHAVVSVKGQFYAVPLTDAAGRVRSQSRLLKSLKKITAASSSSSSSEKVPELGWLTTQPRDEWYQDYCLLQESSAFMRESLETLQSGLLMLCLDDSCENDRDMALRLWHGCTTSSRGIRQAAMNRWWDKSMQVVLAENQQGQQQMGYIGEHSLADGMPAADFCQKIIQQTDYKSDEGDSAATCEITATPIFAHAWASLEEIDRRRICDRVERAKSEHLRITCLYDLQIQQFDKYGSRFIKESVGVSPDAFVQMALQLAASRYFRTSAVATYESTQTRQFLHGRTETTRSVSTHSLAFCRAVADNLPSSRKIQLLRQACDAHTQYTRLAIDGMGCDRHFFGLQHCIQQSEAAPDLFRLPLFEKSKRWLLSTSTLPGTSPGFGPVQEDGIGIGYDIASDHIVLTCTCLRAHNDAVRFRDAMGKALNDMMKFGVMEEKDGRNGRSTSKL